jgi:gluconolactonase
MSGDEAQQACSVQASARKFALLSAGHTLLEAPLWSEQYGLLFADMVAGGVRSFRAGEPVRDIWPHRKGIGGMCLHESGALIVTGKNVAMRAFEGEGVAERTSILLEAKDPRERFNDLTVDHRGRIFVGTYDAQLSLPGRVYLIDLYGSSRAVAEGTMLSNGMAISPGNSRLYQADTLRGVVMVYDIGEDGSLGAPRIFASMPDERPDGLITDRDGNLLVAVCGSSRISVYSDRGAEIDRIAVPAVDVTSLTFGGRELADLYVVSGSPEKPGEGRLYRSEKVAFGGMPFRARIAV